MSDGVSIKVEGLEELAKKIRSLAPHLQDKVLGGAVNAGIQITKKEALSRVPVDSGTLRRSIFVKKVSKNGDGKAEYILGVRHGKKEKKKNRDAYYWFMVEFGTEKKGARPFMRPAFESRKNESFEAIQQKLKSGLDKAVGQKT